MDNKDALFIKNEVLKKQNVFRIINKKIVYQPKVDTINLREISKMISFAKRLNMPNYRFSDIYFDLKKQKFDDKLSYILFEFICKYLRNEKREVYMSLNNDKDIYTEGIQQSPLQYLQSGDKKTRILFDIKFNQEIYKRHYRKSILNQDNNAQIIPSLIIMDVKSFLEGFSINREWASEIAKVVSELIDNAIDHGGSGFFFDMDVTTEYVKVDEGQNEYYGVNIVVLNFSNSLLGDLVKNKLTKKELIDDRLKKIIIARTNHSPYFNQLTYCEDDFYILSSFQDRISGRPEYATTGGTGLTKLIANLEEKSDAYKCYVISGNRKLTFKRHLLDRNEDYWFGFNEQKDFLNMPPSKECFSMNPFFMPGTAYNLNFVLRKEENYADNRT